MTNIRSKSVHDNNILIYLIKEMGDMKRSANICQINI